MQLKRHLSNYFQAIAIRYKYFFVSRKRYAINRIDEKRMRLEMAECGIPFYIQFTHLHAHLSMLTKMSPQDAFVFGFVLSKFGSLGQVQLDKIENVKVEPSFILEAEDRTGRFKFYNVVTKSSSIFNIAELLPNKNMINQISYKDLLQMGISAGKNRRNATLLRQLFMWRMA